LASAAGSIKYCAFEARDENGVNSMGQKLPSAGLLLAVLLAMPGLGSSQAVQPTTALVVSGQPGQAPVLQINGKSYVNLEALARLTNGSLSFKSNQITLTLPGSAASTPATDDQASQPAPSGFTRNFLKAGIEAGSTIREWRTALSSAVQNGYPVTDDFVARYVDQSATSLRLASVAVSTDSDRNAFQLLSNVFDKMQKLSNKILAARQNMSYVSGAALRDDPLNQQILSCARSLASMAASGQFQDDVSCH
jgi:hypothetical protein